MKAGGHTGRAYQRHAADAHISLNLKLHRPCAPLMPGVGRLASSFRKHSVLQLKHHGNS